jgi:phage baseplate assembly protein W/nucleoid-associated protein YgaU
MTAAERVERVLDRLEPAQLVIRGAIAVPCMLDPTTCTVTHLPEGGTETWADVALEREMVERGLEADPPAEWEFPLERRTFGGVASELLSLPSSLALRWSLGPTLYGSCAAAEVLQFDRDPDGEPVLVQFRLAIHRSRVPRGRGGRRLTQTAAGDHRPSARTQPRGAARDGEALHPATLAVGDSRIACVADLGRYVLSRRDDGSRRLAVDLAIDQDGLDESVTVAQVADRLAGLPDSVTLSCPPWPPFAARCVAVHSQALGSGAAGEPQRVRLRLELEEQRDGESRPWTVGSHVVRDGETLPAIAHAYFGDAERWRDLAVTNHITDPAAVRPGTLLRLAMPESDRGGGAGSGLTFPLHVDRVTGEVALAPPEADIEQAIHLILDTAPGERKMRPDFGCAVYEASFETMRASTHRTINRLVREAVERWEPRIWVLGVQSDVSDWREGHVRVSLEYRIRESGDVRSLLHSFAVVPRDGRDAAQDGFDQDRSIRPNRSSSDHPSGVSA